MHCEFHMALPCAGEWSHGGWHEIVDPPRRYRIIARDRLKQLLDADEKTLTDCYERWVEDYIGESSDREKIWTESIAAGSVKFIEDIKAKLGLEAKHRQIRRNGNDQKKLVDYLHSYQ